MTAVDFRCEQCGKLLSVDAQPGGEVTCPHCQKKVQVPAALASLPRPQVPGGPTSASVDAPPAGDVNPTEEELVEVGAPTAAAGTIAALMPWMLSLFLHVGVGLILAFAGMMYVTSKTGTAEDIEIPGETFSKNPGGVIQPGSMGVTRSSEASQAEVNTGVKTSGDSIIMASSGSGGSMMSTMGGDGSSGGGMAKAGLGSGFGRGPKAKFFGTGGGGNIHHVVFVIDRSGSMRVGDNSGNLLNTVKSEMRTTIRGLAEVQDFHIIFFAHGEPLELESKALVPAIQVNKSRAFDFLAKVEGIGKTDPMPALKRAVAVLSNANMKNPGRQIFLLTDGDFPDNQAVVDFVTRECVPKRIYVHTYLFGASGKPSIRDTLQQVAKITGGTFKSIGEE